MAGAPESDGGPQPRCPICHEMILLELCDPSGTVLCPRCGLLLRRFQGRLAFLHGDIKLGTSFTEEFGLDSLDIVELIMELEEEFDVTIPDAEAEQIKTVEDAIRCIRRHQHEETAESAPPKNSAAG